MVSTTVLLSLVSTCRLHYPAQHGIASHAPADKLLIVRTQYTPGVDFAGDGTRR